MLLNDSQSFKQVERVLRSIVLLTHGTENFSLHACTHHPKRIGDAVNDGSARDGRDAVQTKSTFLQLKVVLEEILRGFIHREVKGVEHGRAEGSDTVATVKSTHTLLLRDVQQTTQAM